MHSRTILTQQNIKSMHLKELFLYALRYNGISRAQLKREMNLSFPSISALVDELLSHDILFESGIQEPILRGRPQSLLFVNPSALTIPVLSMTSEGYRCCLFDCTAKKITEDFLPFEVAAKSKASDGQWHPDTQTLLAPIKHWICTLTNYKLSDFVLCFSGNFDDQDIMTSSAVKITTPNDFLFSLKKLLGDHVYIINNADSCAYAEKICQNLTDDFIYIQVSEGVGAGIIRGGKTLHRNILRAGEIGHMSIDYHGKDCICGGRGCLERYISTPEITEEVRQLLNTDSPLDFSEVCKSYLSGDSRIIEVIHQKAHLLAVGISNMLAMQPVQNVILGGDIIMLGDAFLEEVQSVMRQRGLKRYMDRVTISYSQNTENELSGSLWNYLEHQLTIDAMI